MPTTTESFFTTTDKQPDTTERGDATTTEQSSFTTTAHQTESTDNPQTTINMQETTTEMTYTTTNQPGTTAYAPDTTTIQPKEETTSEAGSETTLKPQGSKPGNNSCPPLEEGQAHFVCPTGFKRHPKDCQMFYQCTQSPETSHLSIVTFNCPNGTVYDESMIQCRDRRKDDNCSSNDKLLRGIFESADESSPIVSKLKHLK